MMNVILFINNLYKSQLVGFRVLLVVFCITVVPCNELSCQIEKCLHLRLEVCEELGFFELHCLTLKELCENDYCEGIDENCLED